MIIKTDEWTELRNRFLKLDKDKKEFILKFLDSMLQVEEMAMQAENIRHYEDEEYEDEEPLEGKGESEAEMFRRLG